MYNHYYDLYPVSQLRLHPWGVSEVRDVSGQTYRNRNDRLTGLTDQQEYKVLVNQISASYEQGRQRAIRAVDTQLVQAYWEIGRYIVEFEQGGKERAKYGKALLEQLSTDLSNLYGKGFSRSNLNHMRSFYLTYPNCETVSHKLSWSQYVELLKIDDPLESQLFVSKYQLYLPNKKELRTVIEETLECE